MKRAMVLSLALFSSAVLWASPPVQDMPYIVCTDAFAITLTSYSWTQVPSANCSGRTLVVLNVPATNSGRAVGIVTTSNVTPTASTNTIPIDISAGSDDRGYPISEEGFIWLRTTHTASETIYGQELKQR